MEARDREPSIALVIVNWNSGDWLKRCLQGVARQTVPPNRVYLVDNASTDRSMEGIETILPGIEVIRAERNLGFAAGNNLAFSAVDEQWTALLNPDAIPEPTWLEELYEAACCYPEYSFFACKMMDALQPGILDGAGDVMHLSGYSWPRGQFKHESTVDDTFVELFSACGGAAMYRTALLKQAGGFDERFFCYCEDTDLAFRLRLLGYRCLYVPRAVVAHVGSASTSKKSDFAVYHGHRNMEWVYVKNMPWPLLVCGFPVHVLHDLFVVLRYALRGQLGVILRAKWDALRRVPEFYADRRRIQGQRKVSSRELWRLLDKSILRR